MMGGDKPQGSTAKQTTSTMLEFKRGQLTPRKMLELVFGAAPDELRVEPKVARASSAQVHTINYSRVIADFVFPVFSKLGVFVRFVICMVGSLSDSPFCMSNPIRGAVTKTSYNFKVQCLNTLLGVGAFMELDGLGARARFNPHFEKWGRGGGGLCENGWYSGWGVSLTPLFGGRSWMVFWPGGLFRFL